MAASRNIKTPTSYEEWIKHPTFFDDGVSGTDTQVINDAKLNGTRYAYGASREGYWFYVALTKPEHEHGFWQQYLKWRSTAAADSIHSFESATMTKPPPTCGTPTTPECPPPDDLDEAIRSLAKDLAGVGAAPDQVKAAIARVRAMLITTTTAVRDMLAL